MKRSSFCGALRVSAAFGVAFVVGAIVTFGVFSMAGAAVGVDELSMQWRLGIAAAGLAVFAFCDFVAIRKRSWCPLSWRRQTPHAPRFRYGITTTAAVWGFDTGLTVTTYRVAALTWATLLLTFLGLASWQVGFVYALAFAIPIVTIFNGRPASRPITSVVGLLHKKSMLQRISSITLLTAAALFLTYALKSQF